MANESIAMASVTSMLTQHGGQQAAMSVSLSPANEETQVKQVSIEPITGGQESASNSKALESSEDKALMEKAAQELQERLDNLSKLKGWTINFNLVPEVDQPVVKVIDAETKQVIRQIPSEEMLLISKKLQLMAQSGHSVDSLSGLFFDGQV